MKLELQPHSRSRILATLLVVLMMMFGIRLFYLQVIQHGYYSALADEEQIKTWRIPAQRGLIYAKDGQNVADLVMNETVYTLEADPSIIEESDRVAREIRRIAGGNARSNLDDLLAKTDTRYQVLAYKLTRTQAEKLKDLRFAGLYFKPQSQRVYPEGALASQILGFVDNEGEGRYGAEGGLNERLKGVDGVLKSVKDVRDVPLTIGKENTHIPAQDGDDIVLSIDRNIQAKTEDALKAGIDRIEATKGSAIVMDPHTGRVLSMANYPAYSPASFTEVEDVALFNNAVISAPYEPASVIKTFTMAAGLEEGVVTPGSTYENYDTIKVDDRVIANAVKGHTGTRTMQEVLDWSLNTGTVTIAQRLGNGSSITRGARDTLYEYFYDKFGLGKETGIELSGESNGIVVSPDQSEGNAVRYANMTFGQGLNVTMLQVASGFCSLVNGGLYYQPTIVEGVLRDDGTIDEQQPNIVRRTVSDTTSAQLRTMMHDARGSASWLAGGDRAGYVIGGKTGTAETIVDGTYVKNQTVASYLGYGGAATPEYVIMVQVSAPGKYLTGGEDAGPIFTDISNWMIEYLRIQPQG